MKSSVFVTFADRNYIEQVKQLFSSVYFNAGWKGDYCLYAYDISSEEQKWFLEKGIYIKECKNLNEEIGKKYTSSILHALNMFGNDFKEWNNVVFVEGDMIVRASLDSLAHVKGFYAVPEISYGNIRSQFYLPSLLQTNYSPLSKEDIKKYYQNYFQKLTQEFDVHETVFNFGVMAFSTNVCGEQTLTEAIRLVNMYGPISSYGPQGICNLLFYKKWHKLPAVYNTYVNFWPKIYKISRERIHGIIMHFASLLPEEKPWHRKNPFFVEYEGNLKRADLINLQNIPSGKKWEQKFIREWQRRIIIHQKIYRVKAFINRQLGSLGIYIQKFPFLYRILKKIEKPFRKMYDVGT